ncbi:MAG: hypothetical protein NZV14_15290 [Bryobacteraceae bacterium]|nr:hypothetical protein [Bryobacteraceae bacterium]MDW8379528.1 hypothetical protein [Bryobacterales bacterium]
MTQAQREVTNHVGFQMSLLRLLTIPGAHGSVAPECLKQEADKLEALAQGIQGRKH